MLVKNIALPFLRIGDKCLKHPWFVNCIFQIVLGIKFIIFFPITQIFNFYPIQNFFGILKGFVEFI